MSELPDIDLKLWWLGFDCHHYGDKSRLYNHMPGTFKTVEYCINECEKFSAEILEYEQICCHKKIDNNRK